MSPNALWYKIFLFNLDWFEQPFIFVSSKVSFAKLGCEEFSYKTVSQNVETAICKCSSEAVAQRCSVKKVFLIEILQNSQENTCARWQLYLKRDPGTGVSCEFFEILKNIFSYRTPLMATSSFSKSIFL